MTTGQSNSRFIGPKSRCPNATVPRRLGCRIVKKLVAAQILLNKADSSFLLDVSVSAAFKQLVVEPLYYVGPIEELCNQGDRIREGLPTTRPKQEAIPKLRFKVVHGPVALAGRAIDDDVVSFLATEVEKTILDGPSRIQKEWYRVGGLAALVLGIGYVIIIPLYAHVGAPPNGGEAWFKYLPGKTTVWWTILGLSVFTDFLYVPVAFAMYLALKELNRNLVLLAIAFVGLFVVLDLAVTWSHYASVLTLYRNYATASDDARRASYIAAANCASAMLNSPLEIVYAIVTLSSGILLFGLVMLRGAFNKTTAYLALGTGVLGILSLTGFSFAIIGNALVATVWLFFVSHRLYRLAQV